MLRPLTILLILALLVAICSCDRRNPILPEEQEAQKIEFLEDIIPIESGDFIYRQGLQLTQESDDLSFAFRLSTLKAGDIPGFTTDNEGWLIFPNQSIWTTQSHLSLDWLFGFGCKPTDSPTYPPTEAEYNLLSTKYVAYRYQNAGSNLVVFGFPLSFMEQDSVAQNLNIILSNIFGGSMAQRRRP